VSNFTCGGDVIARGEAVGKRIQANLRTEGVVGAEVTFVQLVPKTETQLGVTGVVEEVRWGQRLAIAVVHHIGSWSGGA